MPDCTFFVLWYNGDMNILFSTSSKNNFIKFVLGGIAVVSAIYLLSFIFMIIIWGSILGGIAYLIALLINTLQGKKDKGPITIEQEDR